MAKPNKPEDYKKLKKIWYKKLAKSGFNDIETDENNLKIWSSRWARPAYVASAQTRTAYYEMADRFLLEYEFESNLDRSIWEYHCGGVSFRNIETILRKARVRRISKTKIGVKIKALRSIMYSMYVKKDE